MADAAQELANYWGKTAVKTVSHWTDSSYGPLEQKEILEFARDMAFPLSSFTCSFGGGLTEKGDFKDPAGKPAEVVLIEMGYNDTMKIGPQEATVRMQQRPWYNVLWQHSSEVKFVVFVHQPDYRQVCPPRKTKKKKSFPDWKEGALLRGSKYTDQAIALVEQLGIFALCLKAPVEEIFGGMLVTDEEGDVWQNRAKCRDHVNHGVDHSEDGELALWADSEHPTAKGAEVHFRCLVQTFLRRFDNPGVVARPAPTVKTVYSAPPQLARPQATSAAPATGLWQKSNNRARSRSRSRNRPTAANNAAVHRLFAR